MGQHGSDTAGPVDALQQNRFQLLFDITGQWLGNYTHGDTVGFLGAGNPTKATRQLPTTWNDSCLAINVYFHDKTSEGKHFCIDSSFFGNGGVWKWVGMSLTDYFPTWVGLPGQSYDLAKGGYCFTIFREGPSATLQVSPLVLNYTAVQGGASPATQKFAVTEASALVIPYTVTKTGTGTWITLSKTSGNTPD